MKDKIKAVPLALASLLLGVAALGNLLAGFWLPIRLFLQLPVAFGVILLLARLWLTRPILKNEFKSPVVASCFAALLMTFQLLTAALPFPPAFGHSLWLLGFINYAAYILYFTKQFALKQDLKLVYPSWFIVYVGIAMVSVTAPVYGQFYLGWVALVIATVGYLVFIPFVVYRLFKHRIEEKFLPIVAILAAPTSLILTAYLTLSPNPNRLLTVGLALIAQIVYFGVLINFTKLHGKSEFSPLFAAFTFPFVSTAIGFKLLLAKLSITNPFLLALGFFEVAVSILIVAYVGYRYLKFFLSDVKVRPVENKI